MIEGRAAKETRSRIPLICMLVGVCLFWQTPPAVAEEILLEMPNGLTARAEYSRGNDDRPVVLILHGFLQTYEFPTVARLANSLREEGLTVLTPSLTLGIDNRNQSLSCEAIHKHNMHEDSEELRAWVSWLHAQTGKPVTLIGHSIGSLNLLGLMQEPPRESVERLVLISLLSLDEDTIMASTKESYERALENLERGKLGLANYSLSFCERYPSEVEDFLSYRSWTSEKTTRVLNSLDVPAYVILGSRDDRMSAGWRSKVSQTSAQVILVEGAGHFFDTQYEFDLLDEVLAVTGSN